MNPHTYDVMYRAIYAQWEANQLGLAWADTDSFQEAEAIWHQWKQARDDAQEKMKAAFEALNLEAE